MPQIQKEGFINPFPKIFFTNNFFLAVIHLLKVNYRNTFEICSKLTIKTSQQRQWRHPDVFIVNFEHISHLVLVFLLLILNL